MLRTLCRPYSLVLRFEQLCPCVSRVVVSEGDNIPPPTQAAEWRRTHTSNCTSFAKVVASAAVRSVSIGLRVVFACSHKSQGKKNVVYYLCATDVVVVGKWVNYFGWGAQGLWWTVRMLTSSFALPCLQFVLDLVEPIRAPGNPIQSPLPILHDKY
jgi:hypothetical protein